MVPVAAASFAFGMLVNGIQLEAIVRTYIDGSGLVSAAIILVALPGLLGPPPRYPFTPASLSFHIAIVEATRVACSITGNRLDIQRE